MIKTDSVVFYMPLLPAKEIRFCEIDFVHDTDNNTYGLCGRKMLTGYHGGKKLFSVDEDVIGYLFLRALLYDRGKVEYVPVMENPTDEKTMKRAPVVEDFSVTSKTGDKVRTVVSFLILAPLSVYILWDRADFGLGYQIIAAGMLLGILLDLFSELLWKVTVDFRTISIRNILGIVKTYEMRQITKVVEQEQHIVLYAGQKKWQKLQSAAKTFNSCLNAFGGWRSRYKGSIDNRADCLLHRCMTYLFGEIQNQIIIIFAFPIGLTYFVLIPDTGTVWQIPAFHVHSLGASITAVKPYA